MNRMYTVDSELGRGRGRRLRLLMSLIEAQEVGLDQELLLLNLVGILVRGLLGGESLGEVVLRK